MVQKHQSCWQISHSPQETAAGLVGSPQRQTSLSASAHGQLHFHITKTLPAAFSWATFMTSLTNPCLFRCRPFWSTAAHTSGNFLNFALTLHITTRLFDCGNPCDSAWQPLSSYRFLLDGVCNYTLMDNMRYT